jgi:hypothetical protein
MEGWRKRRPSISSMVGDKKVSERNVKKRGEGKRRKKKEKKEKKKRKGCIELQYYAICGVIL